MLAKLPSILSLLKLRVVALLILSAAVSMVLTGNFLWQRLFFLLLSGSLASGGAACLNNYLDRDIDALMNRTKNRPLPSGKLSPKTALTLGILLLILSIILALNTLNPQTTFLILAGAFIYLVVYTVGLKRRHYLNIVIGGLAGSALPLAGWSAVSQEISFLPAFLAAFIFLWIPSHVWSLALAYREDYQRAHIPMLPAITDERKAAKVILLNAVLLFLFSLLPFFLGYSRWLYLLGAISGGLVFLWLGIRLVKETTFSLAWTNFKFSVLYLAWLLLFLLLDSFLR